MPGPIEAHVSGVLIHVWVVPGAAGTGIAGRYGDNLKIRVAVPPQGGKANRAVVGLLTDLLGTDVELVRGMTSREKVFLASGINAKTALFKLGD